METAAAVTSCYEKLEAAASKLKSEVNSGIATPPDHSVGGGGFLQSHLPHHQLIQDDINYNIKTEANSQSPPMVTSSEVVASNMAAAASMAATCMFNRLQQQQQQQQQDPDSSPTSSSTTTSLSSGTTTSLSANYGHANPHGIDTILNRRSAAAAAALTSLTAAASAAAASSVNSSSSPEGNTPGANPPNAPGTNPSVNPYFKLEDLHHAAAAAAQAAQQVQQQQHPHHQRANPNLYWPGIQGLIANPNLWRDRFNGTDLHSHK